MDPEEYIRDARRGGISDAGIEKILINMGHDPEQVRNWLTHGAASAMWHPPAGAAVPAGNTVAASAPAPRRSLGVIIGILAVLFLGGSGAFAYIKLAEPSPAEVLRKALANEAKISTVEYLARVSVQADPEKIKEFLPDPSIGKDGKFELEIGGKADLTRNGEGSLTIGVNQPWDVAVDLMWLKEMLYLRLRGSLNFGFFDLSSVKDQWISISMEEAKGRVDEYASGSTAELSEERIARLKQAFAEADIFRIEKELPAEEEYHYQYSVSEEGLIEFYAKALEIMEEPDRAEMMDAVRDSLRDVEFLPGEIWVSKGDMYLRRLLVNMSITEAEDEPAYDMVFTLEQKNINQPLGLKPPAGSRSLEEVMGSFMAGFGPAAGSLQGL